MASETEIDAILMTRTRKSINTKGFIAASRSSGFGSVSGTSCSSLCLHPWNKKPAPIDHTAEIEAQEKITILKLQIEAKQRAVKQYRELCDVLKQQNRGLKNETAEVSGKANSKVTKLLEKYESYATSSKTLKRTHAREQVLARQDLKVTSEQVYDELKNFRDEVIHLDGKLGDLHQDLQTLRTYKDKEYPVKAMQISRLGKEVDKLAVEQRIETADIDRITFSERKKLHAHRENKIKEIMETAADEAFTSKAPVGLQALAWHNSLLRHEIEQQKWGIRDVEDEIFTLQREIKELKRIPQTHVRSFVFPEAFLPSAICHPDEDVILDIPCQQPLPI